MIGLSADQLTRSVKVLVLIHTTYTNPVEANMAAWILKPLEIINKLTSFLMIPLPPLVWWSNWQSYFNGSLYITARSERFTGKQCQTGVDFKLGRETLSLAFPRCLHFRRTVQT